MTTTDAMSDEKLKPCPFCGGDTHLHYDPKSEMFGPVSEHARGCPIMNFDLVDYSDEHVAVTRWNTRSAQAPAGDGWRDEDLAPAILEMAKTAAGRQEEGFWRNRALANVEEVRSLPFTSPEWQTAFADARTFLTLLAALPPEGEG